MKKIFTLFAVLFAGLALTASEAAVKKVVVDCVKAQAELDGAKSLSFCHKNYQGISAKGEKIAYAQVQKICQAMEVMKKISGPNWSVVDFMELTAIMQGRELTDAERQQLQLINNDPEVKKQLAAAVPQAQAMIKQMQKQLEQSCKSIKFVSVNINGNKAVAVYTCTDITTGKLQKTTTELVKENGKWLIIKETSQYVK